MKLTFLGTGTSTGVPQLMCDCETCRSADSRDKRMRASALLTVGGKNILIDCGPDFRSQMLAVGGMTKLDALLVTHTHYDHVGGIDDLRPYSYMADGFPIYCRPDVACDLKARVPYCFVEKPYPGVPHLSLIEIADDIPFDVEGLRVTPLPVMHYKLPIVGFKIGGLAYITDAKDIPESTARLVEGVDTLVVNALRVTPHMSHMSLGDALAFISRVKPRVAYLTHLSHDMGPHASAERLLPPGVRIAYDGLTVDIP